MIINIINTNKTLLIEDHIADIDVSGTQIYQDKRDIFCINRFKTIRYNSMDPTFCINNNNDMYVISYTYNNTIYYGVPMSTYNVDIISNYAFLHDVIFSYVLKQY